MPLENLQLSLLSKYVGEQFMSNFVSARLYKRSFRNATLQRFKCCLYLKTTKIFKAVVFTAW